MYEFLGFIFSAIIFVKILWYICLFLNTHIYGGLFEKKRLKSYGEWAVVTGATRGLGVHYCQQLAEMGLNIILVARNENLLKQMAKELEQKFSVKTAIAIADFGDVSEKNFNNVRKVLHGKDIGILLNNAGMMYDRPDLFHHIKSELLQNMINVNNIWSQELAHYVLKEHMLPQNRGLIVFMSSIIDERQSPMLTAYGATKAYIAYLVKCLSVEYRNTNVKFQVLSPSYIATDMTNYNEFLNTPSLMSPSGETYVKHALRTFGVTLQSSGYLPHDIQREASLLMPHALYRIICQKVQEHVVKTGRCP